MISNSDPFSLTLLRYGPLAAQALTTATRGEIIAVFRSCFYANLKGRFVCIGNVDFMDGPLNVVSSAPAETNWAACGLKIGDKAVLQNNRLSMGAQLMFDLRDATLWQPASIPGPIDMPAAIHTLQAFYLSNRPTEGLAPVVFGARDAELKQARQPLNALSGWLENNLCPSNPVTNCVPIEDLLGLGPGLTPSGDDFIGAMMITLNTLNERTPLSSLANTVISASGDHTNPISAQHLFAASQGLGSAAFHAVLTALGSTDRNQQTGALTKLISIGHTSGWDALAGLYMTLKIWHDARRSNPIAA